MNIDPRKIIQRSHFFRGFSYLESPAIVKDGDWDQDGVCHFSSDTEILESYKTVLNGGRWEDTFYFKQLLSRIKRGDRPYDCKSIEDLKAKCAKNIQLYESIKHNGWKQSKKGPYVTINFDRFGRPLFNDGRHRLACALLLGLYSIPVKVAVRHTEWVRRRQLIARAIMTGSGERKRIYAGVHHPDMADTGGMDPRVAVILEQMPRPGMRVLDIGAHTGQTSVPLGEAGHRVTAVEQSESRVAAMKYFSEAMQANVAARQGDALEALESEDAECLICMNILPYLIRTNVQITRLNQALGKMQNLEVIFLQTRWSEEDRKNIGVWHPEPEVMAMWLSNATGLSNIKQIGQYRGRPLYRIT